MLLSAEPSLTMRRSITKYLLSMKYCYLWSTSVTGDMQGLKFAIFSVTKTIGGQGKNLDNKTEELAVMDYLEPFISFLVPRQQC